jgi:hypothetical protein
VQRNVTYADVVRHSKVKDEATNSSTQMGARNQGQSATAVRVGISRRHVTRQYRQTIFRRKIRLFVKFRCPFIPKTACRFPIDPIPHDRSITRDNYAPRTASRMCCGVIGVRLNSTLNGRSASEIAFARAAGGPIGPPSPTPLTPNGLSGDGECW